MVEEMEGGVGGGGSWRKWRVVEEVDCVGGDGGWWWRKRGWGLGLLENGIEVMEEVEMMEMVQELLGLVEMMELVEGDEVQLTGEVEVMEVTEAVVKLLEASGVMEVVEVKVHLPVSDARCGTTGTGSFLFIYLGLWLSAAGPFTSAMSGATGLCQTVVRNPP